MPDYAAIAVKVQAGLTKAGFMMTLRKVTDGTYNPATGVFSGGSTADYPIVGILQSQRLSSSEGAGTGQNFFNGVLVQTDDQFVLLAASAGDVDPAPGDLLIITGVTYSIVTMIPVRPGGVDLMYRVLARK
jgi:hypothetical protein